MKRRIVIFSLAALLCVAAVVAWKYRAAIFRNGEVSELYMRYKDTPGVDATFIRGFQVNDTLTLDVTLLEAITDSAWAVLVRDFKMDELSPLLQMLIDRGENLVFSKLISKSVPSASAENDVLAYSYTTRSVSIFHIANDGEKHAVLYHNIKKSIDQDN